MRLGRTLLAALLVLLLVAVAAPARATVSTTTSTVTLQGNSATVSFTYGFIIPAASQAIVSIVDTTVTPNTTTILLPTQYHITGIGSTTGGAVTYPLAGLPLAAGKFIVISRVVPLIQTVSIRSQGPTFASIENALDYLTYITQQLASSSASTVAGGANGQIQYNNGGYLGGFTVSGDGTLVATTGALTVTKTNGTAFGPFATDNATQATAALNAFTSSLQGVAPSSGGGTTNFLRADGTWAAPSSSGSGTVNSGTLGQVGYYATSGTAISGSAGASLSGGTLTLGSTGVLGSLALSGSTSGVLTLRGAAASGTNTITFPAGTTDLSATGGTSQFVKQASAGAALTVARPACTDLSDSTSACTTSIGTSGATIPLLNAANTWSGVQSFNSGDVVLNGSGSGTLTVKPAAAAGSNTLTLPAGTTDLSATGGTSQVLKQISAGAAITVARLACADLSDATALCSATTPLSVASGGTGLASGTSGGVLAYTASGTLASSGALTANLPVIGGGAGVAPTVGSRSGNTTEFGTVSGSLTSGNCLKADASGNIVDNGSACAGGTAVLTLLATLTASTSASLSDTTHITSTYKAYLIVFTNLLPTNNNKSFLIRFSTDSGSTWLATGYHDVSGATIAMSCISVNGSIAGAGQVQSGFSNTANLGGLTGSVVFSNPNGTAGGASISGAVYGGTVNTNDPGTQLFGGSNTTTSVINGIEFLFSGDTIASGTVKLYGIS